MQNSNEDVEDDGNNGCNMRQKIQGNEKGILKSVDEIPEKFRTVFNEFKYFNAIQSAVFERLLYTDETIVVSAPTGSGKTVIFELAIIRLLSNLNYNSDNINSFKIIYLAPVKALCSERVQDWKEKLCCLGINCIEITGDTEDVSDLLAIKHYQLVVSTPEKWDQMTRRWKDNKALIQMIKLFMIDEVHLLNEDTRGSTLEAVVSRMKTVQQTVAYEQKEMKDGYRIRFIAVSATIPNIEDIATWLTCEENNPAYYCKMNEDMRPVKLEKVVKGYFMKPSQSIFQFDMSLSYRLKAIILEYSQGKPTLIFCNSRKSVTQTCNILVQQISVHFTDDQNSSVEQCLQIIMDGKIKDYLKGGVGIHHAGMLPNDRMAIEKLFKTGRLPILVATSTLAVGVNLPAHLVIIKCTEQYAGGVYREYTEGQILQMAGRAGRPQFDNNATVVIMTNSCKVNKYEKMVDGNNLIESNLHKHLIEHLNAEIVLGTIIDIAVAMNWIRSTFLYVRALKNPGYYAFPPGRIDLKLQELCHKELNALVKYEIISMDDGYDIKPTQKSLLMARYYLNFATMKIFNKLNGGENMCEMIEIISETSELEELKLRMNERGILNLLNNSKSNETIRFPFKRRISNVHMKVNCLLQAALGCIGMQDFSLMLDTNKIIRIATRIVRALKEYLWQSGNQNKLSSLVSCCTLAKCIHAHLWENSKHVCRQLPGVGVAIGTSLVSAGYCTLDSIISCNPRDLERLANKNPPWGNELQNMASQVPIYSLKASIMKECLSIHIELCNSVIISSSGEKDRFNDSISLIVGNEHNDILHKQRISNRRLINQGGKCVINVNINNEKSPRVNNTNCTEISCKLISDQWVGQDKEINVTKQFINSAAELKNEQPSIRITNDGVGAGTINKKKPEHNSYDGTLDDGNDKTTIYYKMKYDNNNNNGSNRLKTFKNGTCTNNVPQCVVNAIETPPHYLSVSVSVTDNINISLFDENNTNYSSVDNLKDDNDIKIKRNIKNIDFDVWSNPLLRHSNANSSSIQHDVRHAHGNIHVKTRQSQINEYQYQLLTDSGIPLKRKFGESNYFIGDHSSQVSKQKILKQRLQLT